MRKVAVAIDWLPMLLSLVVTAPAVEVGIRSNVTSPVIRTSEQRFLAGLRERRLFTLAEAYCLDRLPKPNLPERRRAELAIELGRTYALHATQSIPGEGSALWEKAHQVGSDFEASFPSSPFLVLVLLQDAITRLAQGEIAQVESQFIREPNQLLERSRKHLRSAVRRLDSIAATVAEQLRRRHRLGRSDAAGLTLIELEALQKNLAHHRARALRIQGQCYDRGSPDHINSLTQAIELLAPLAELAVADDLVWRSRIDRIVCLRLMGSLDRAAEELNHFMSRESPPDIASRGRAEQIRLHLDRGRYDKALAEAKHAVTTTNSSSADLDFARLEATLAAWGSAVQKKQTELAKQLVRQATSQVQRFELVYGLYWMRRAESLFASQLIRSDAGSDVAALIRAADSFYRGRQLGEALATYDRAIAQAMTEGETNEAFRAAFTAATIQHERQQHQDACRRYRKLALNLSKHPRAAEAHLLATFNAAELARNSAPQDRSTAIDRYLALIEEHLAQWPSAPSTDQVYWWLGNLREAQKQWPEAMSAYRTIRPNQPQSEAASQAVLRCYQHLLSQPNVTAKLKHQWVQEAVNYLYRSVLGPEGRWPDSWSSHQRHCAVAVARMLLHRTGRGHAPAEQILAAALSGSPTPRAEWASEARALLLVSLAEQGKIVEAEELIEQVTGVPVEGLLSTAESLLHLAPALPPDHQERLAMLVLRLLEFVASSQEQIEPNIQQRVQWSHAAALAAAGRHQEALQAYELLARDNPQDGRVHEAQANLLLATSRSPQELQAALDKWREVERHCRPGSPRWFRARLAQAQAYVRKNEEEKAAKLIQLTRLLHPELGGAEMRSKFLDLLEMCQ